MILQRFLKHMLDRHIFSGLSVTISFQLYMSGLHPSASCFLRGTFVGSSTPASIFLDSRHRTATSSNFGYRRLLVEALCKPGSCCFSRRCYIPTTPYSTKQRSLILAFGLSVANKHFTSKLCYLLTLLALETSLAAVLLWH